MKKAYQSVLLLSVLATNMGLTGCIDLATTKSLASTQQHVFKSKAQVFVMRGGLGGLFSKGMNRLQSRLEKDYNIHAESTVWYKQTELSSYIIKNYGTKTLPGPIVLAGHSLGANDQIKVATALDKAHIPVALLIIVDATSPRKVPPNVKQVLNIYKPSYVPIFKGLEVVAMDPTRTKVENINATTVPNCSVNHFNIEKHPYMQTLMINHIKTAIHYDEKSH